MEKRYQYIIVGSGPGAVMAAQTLTEAAKEVLMLDVGNSNVSYGALVPDDSYIDIRKSDNQQHRYFLGDDFEAVPSPDITTGAQLTPTRKHIIKEVDLWSPMVSDNFSPMESLAKGGLGVGWGLGAYVYSDAELKKVGLPIQMMKESYNLISERIGISCGNDDVTPYIIGDLKNVQPPLKPDNSVANMLAKYQRQKAIFQKEGITFGLPSMALLSEDMGKRKASNYADMDFYSDERASAWRPAFTIDMLIKYPNFTYLPRHYVTRFQENARGVEVVAIEMEEEKEVKFYAETLLLGAGALGTARIALRSLPVKNLPILCNSYTYMPAIHLSMLGKPLSKHKTSMAQAMMIYDPDGRHSDVVSVAIFTYRSLLLMRLIQQSPLNISDNRQIFKWLQSAFVIAGIHHPDEFSKDKKLWLEESDTSKTGDALHVDFKIKPTDFKHLIHREKKIRKALRRMGVFPIKRIDPGAGSSIHYGGTIPFSDKDVPGTSSIFGRLHGTSNIYTVDGSSFKYLPAKGVTLSIMANAHRVSKQLIDNE